MYIRVVNSHKVARFQWQLFLNFKGFGARVGLVY